MRNGQPLYRLTRDELHKRGLMGPWTFNLYEVVVAAVPTIVLLRILDFFTRGTRSVVSLNPFESAMGRAGTMLGPLVVPVALTLSVYLIARGSLKRDDISSDRLARARYAYLYLDGAYGLLAQAAVAFGIALHTYSIVGYQVLGATTTWVTAIFVIGGSLHEFHLTWYAIPSRLFSVNGYDPKLSIRDQPDGAPWTRYANRLVRAGFILAIGFAIAYYMILIGLAQGLMLLQRLN